MSSSAYPVIWALKHAPVADALERLILIAMADAADADGCNSYRSITTHMLIAKDVAKCTIIDRQKAMAARGLIRHDTTPPPPHYLKIPANRRPVRWEICIPCSWWSDAQREDIQRYRADRGLPPITPESRPDLPDAPPRKARADKGKPKPRRKATRPPEDRGSFKQPHEADARGSFKQPPEVASSDPQGLLEATQPSLVDPPVEPSLPPLRVSVDEAGPTGGTGAGGREGAPQTDHMAAARALVDDLPPVGGRVLADRNRPPLVEGIAARLAAGWTAAGLRAELTKNLHNAGSAGIYPHRLDALPMTPPRHRRAPTVPASATAAPPAPHPWSAGPDGACTECGATWLTPVHTGSAGPARRHCEHGRVIQVCPSCRDTAARSADDPADARSAPPEGDAMDAHPSALLTAAGGSARG